RNRVDGCVMLTFPVDVPTSPRGGTVSNLEQTCEIRMVAVTPLTPVLDKKRLQTTQPAILESTEPATLTSQQGSSAQNVIWPLLGFPVGHTPPGYIPTQQVPRNTQTPQNRAEDSNTHATRVPLIKPVFVSQQENLDDPRNAYQGPDLFDDVPKVNSNVIQLEEVHQKFKAIEDRLSMMEGGGDPQDPANMCLVPDLVLPPKFKVPDFEKYKGLSCPKNHLIMYSRKMAS
ncbi:gag-pro-like protein, partial [Trifolium pratense]